MVSFKGHFDGKSIVFDEPASLKAGQSVRVELIEADEKTLQVSPIDAPWKGKLHIRDEKDEVILEDFKDYLP